VSTSTTFNWYHVAARRSSSAIVGDRQRAQNRIGGRLNRFRPVAGPKCRGLQVNTGPQSVGSGVVGPAVVIDRSIFDGRRPRRRRRRHRAAAAIAISSEVVSRTADSGRCMDTAYTVARANNIRYGRPLSEVYCFRATRYQIRAMFSGGTVGRTVQTPAPPASTSNKKLLSVIHITSHNLD